MRPTKIFGLGGMQEIGKSTLIIEYDKNFTKIKIQPYQCLRTQE